MGAVYEYLCKIHILRGKARRTNKLSLAAVAVPKPRDDKAIGQQVCSATLSRANLSNSAAYTVEVLVGMSKRAITPHSNTTIMYLCSANQTPSRWYNRGV